MSTYVVSSTHQSVKRELDDFAAAFASSVESVVRRYFDDQVPGGSRLSITDLCKVVARLEIRRGMAYLNVSLGEVGEEGEVALTSAVPLSFRRDRSFAFRVEGRKSKRCQTR